MQVIDAHLHLFDLEQGDYAWLAQHNPPFWPDKSLLRNNFTEQDISLSAPLALAGFVHLEAGFDNQQPWREIAWLESHCQLPFKAVAYIDLLLPNEQFAQHLQRLLEFRSLVGCRYIFDEQAAHLLDNPDVLQNLTQLGRHDLSFDLQMDIAQLESVTRLCQVMAKNPALRVIVNHAGWPPYQGEKIDVNANNGQNWLNWQKGLGKLGAFKQCAIKCSGWEMSERDYQAPWPQDVIKQCLAAFDINRVMLASNFPLCQFSQTYRGLWQDYLQILQKLGLDEKQSKQLLGHNALLWYKFDLDLV